jgi:hypothetical protein
MPIQPDYFAGGDHNAFCAKCGAKKKASYLKLQWQGYYVCPEHWEPRQPQDFVRSIREHPEVPWNQDPADIELNNFISWQNNKLEYVQFVNKLGLQVQFYAPQFTDTPDV